MNEKIKRCPFCGGLAITDPSTKNNTYIIDVFVLSALLFQTGIAPSKTQ